VNHCSSVRVFRASSSLRRPRCRLWPLRLRRSLCRPCRRPRRRRLTHRLLSPLLFSLRPSSSASSSTSCASPLRPGRRLLRPARPLCQHRIPEGSRYRCMTSSYDVIGSFRRSFCSGRPRGTARTTDGQRSCPVAGGWYSGLACVYGQQKGGEPKSSGGVAVVPRNAGARMAMASAALRASRTLVAAPPSLAATALRARLSTTAAARQADAAGSAGSAGSSAAKPPKPADELPERPPGSPQDGALHKIPPSMPLSGSLR